MKEPVCIYVASHKQSDFPADTGYLPIQVGRALSQIDLGILRDDEGESISHLNPYFCELTALYWIWKNDSHTIVGLNHYRRFFSHKQNFIDYNGHKIASSNDFSEFDEGADVIVATPVGRNVKNDTKYLRIIEQYSLHHYVADLFLVRKLIRSECPTYLEAFDFFFQGDRMSPYNMVLARRSLFNEYCEWLFTILLKLEKQIPYTFYSTHQARVFGFIAERIFNVWLLENRNRFKIVYRPAKIIV